MVLETPEQVTLRLGIETKLLLQWSWNVLRWMETHIIQVSHGLQLHSLWTIPTAAVG